MNRASACLRLLATLDVEICSKTARMAVFNGFSPKKLGYNECPEIEAGSSSTGESMRNNISSIDCNAMRRLMSALMFLICGVAVRPAQAQTFSVFFTFTNTAQGEQPEGTLIADTSGNLYGTTQYGGTAGGYGTIFRLTPSGQETVLYSFSGTPDGEDPYAGLVADSAGNLYGTTLYGGTNGGYGTVFKLDRHRQLTLLHSFASNPDGADPYGAVVGDAAGNGYGTTRFGGEAGGYGTVWKIDRNGVGTLLHSFSGTPDGEDPEAGLIIDAAGNLYGTTVYGGEAGGYGTVFRVDGQTGKLNLLHSFAGTPDGENPYGALVADGEGNLYGTTKYGGTAGGFGTIFKIDRFGNFSLLYSFSGMPDGENPLSSLVLYPQGNPQMIFGTTYYGGNRGYGTIFQLNIGGQLIILHNFDSSPDGGNPIGGLLRDSAGNLYGTTSQGGDPHCGFSGCGTVFKLTP